jgi:transcriptional regulator GlxA family with amidase domain
MERNLARTVPISEIASSLETSTRQLERLFKASIGCAPQVAYRQIRLKHARWMLRSGLSLTSIAADTGFSDGTHFGKAFKAMYGINPSEERRRMAQKVDGLAETARVGVEAIRVFDTAVERP